MEVSEVINVTTSIGEDEGEMNWSLNQFFVNLGALGDYDDSAEKIETLMIDDEIMLHPSPCEMEGLGGEVTQEPVSEPPTRLIGPFLVRVPAESAETATRPDPPTDTICMARDIPWNLVQEIMVASAETQAIDPIPPIQPIEVKVDKAPGTEAQGTVNICPNTVNMVHDPPPTVQARLSHRHARAAAFREREMERLEAQREPPPRTLPALMDVVVHPPEDPAGSQTTSKDSGKASNHERRTQTEEELGTRKSPYKDVFFYHECVLYKSTTRFVEGDIFLCFFCRSNLWLKYVYQLF
jgi:hypothetical protein